MCRFVSFVCWDCFKGAGVTWVFSHFGRGLVFIVRGPAVVRIVVSDFWFFSVGMGRGCVMVGRGGVSHGGGVRWDEVTYGVVLGLSGVTIISVVVSVVPVR